MSNSFFLYGANLPDELDDTVERYNDFLQHGWISEASKALNQILNAAPDNKKVLWTHASFSYEHGYFGEALSSLDKLIQKNASNQRALALRIRIHQDLGNFEAVVQDATKLLGVDGNDMFALLSRMRAHTQLGDLTTAVEDAHRLLRRPEAEENSVACAEAYFCRAKATLYVRDNLRGIQANLDKCIQYAKQSSEVTKGFEALLFRSRVHIDQSNFGLALEDLDGYLDKYPKSVEALKLRLKVHKAMGDKENETLDRYAILRAHRKFTRVEKATALLQFWEKEQEQEEPSVGQKRDADTQTTNEIKRTRTN